MKYILYIALLSGPYISLAQTNIILNKISKDSVSFYIGFPKVTEDFNYIQAAQKFSTEKAGSILERVDLGRLIIRVNLGEASIGEPTKATFLLKIYDVNSLTGEPGTSLIKEPIKVVNRRNSIVNIDLRKHKILIPGKEFFVGIEWIINRQNQRLIELHRSIELIPGRKFRKTGHIYEPFLGMVKNNKTTSGAWVMTPEGRWKNYTHNLPYMTDLAISAHVAGN